MLTDQHGLKRKSILHNFDIYLKYALKNFIQAILYRIWTNFPWRDFTKLFGKLNTILKKFIRCYEYRKLLK